ncbi:hypothetical protein [Neobacillus sp. Marseille-QA0830]
MSYLIFACSLVLVLFIVYFTKNFSPENQSTPGLQTRLLQLLQFVKFAPVLAFIILLVLVLTYFHTKMEIRLSHAWYDSQFWAYTALLYCLYRISKHKLNLIFTVISFLIAIYNTPLFHYEKLFTGQNIIVSNLIGIVMFLSMWLAVSMLNKRMHQHS